MPDDFRTYQGFPLRCQWPSTSLGKWSLVLSAGFIILMSALFAILSHSGATDDFILTCTAAALLLVVGGLIAAGTAVARKGERSILMLLPLLAGGLALIMAIGELVGDR